MWDSIAATGLCATEASPQIEEIVVTGEFRSDPIDAFPSSISVATAQQIAQLQAQQLEQILALMPNVNYASGASRGRYLQIRGIGETGQFVEPLNSSVGLIVDHVDFSGIGTISTLYDVRQVEVFRGPQGTLYGANALAGLVNVTTNDPGDTLDAGITVEGGDYDTASLGGYVSGPLLDTLDGRLAIQQYKSDGYINNRYLNRDNTNNFDELTMRGKLRWQPNETTNSRYRRRIHRRRQRLRRFFARQQSQHDLGPARQGYSEVPLRQHRGDAVAAEDISDRDDRLARRFGHRVWL